MLVGYNYPWPGNRYITIGPNLAPRSQPQPWTLTKVMEENLKTLKKYGVSVVRIWLMGDGANYDDEVTYRPTSYWSLSHYDWDFKPEGCIYSDRGHDQQVSLGPFGLPRTRGRAQETSRHPGRVSPTGQIVDRPHSPGGPPQDVIPPPPS